MTAVASPPTFPAISRPPWGSIDGSAPMNHPDDVRGMFVPQRKPLSRTNSSSSIQSSASSTSSTSTALTSNSQLNGGSNGAPGTPSDLSQWSSANGTAAARNKRPLPKTQQQQQPWPPQQGGGRGDIQPDFSRLAAGGRPNGMVGAHGPLPPGGPNQMQQMNGQGMMSRPMSGEQIQPGQPVLYLLSLNGTFERKTIAVPLVPETLRIGRQTNQRTIPTATNGFFDSKVLSRQHAEVYAERNGKIYIRDVKSSNGTFVNGTRLSQENRESEPHELQTGDHLELGIDIVSEDQKTVVHHKVAAKVEHAGFMSSSNNVMDMNFGDLDPANNPMMMPNGPLQMRGRTGSNASINSNGRMMPNAAMMAAQANGMPQQQRPFFLSPIATDQILKRLANEMRNARVQAQDLSRTHQFVNTLLSKNDVKDLEKPDLGEVKAHPMVNGNGLPFRHDPKARFSEPPAPPPQQPLPEKPDSPSLRRHPSDRPKSGPSSSPARQENLSQIIQLTEALGNAKRDIDAQTARMRELEIMLQKEREARELAEDLAKRLEESAKSQTNGVAVPPVTNGIDEPTINGHDEDDTRSESENTVIDIEVAPTETDSAKETAISLQFRIDSMEDQMKTLSEQVEMWKSRCEEAESARDADRKTLAEMVVQLRAEEARRVSRERRSRSRRRAAESKTETTDSQSATATESEDALPQTDGSGSSDDTVDLPTLSRANTITPYSANRGKSAQSLETVLPYASAMGVVLIGMGMMAYLNGWEAPPPRVDP